MSKQCLIAMFVKIVQFYKMNLNTTLTMQEPVLVELFSHRSTRLDGGIGGDNFLSIPSAQSFNVR